jgi:ABC-type multidrug transport system fused ATPase/permease subunit
VALATAPLLFVTAARYTRLTRHSARRRRAAEGAMSGLVTESLQGVRTVHAFGRQGEHDRRFADVNQRVLGTGLRAVDLRARFTPILEIVSAVGTSALLFVGGYGVLAGWWTVGVLVVVTSYLRDMLKPLRSMSRLALTFTNGAVSAERVAAVLDSPRRAVRPRPDLPHRITGAVELRGVTLDYGRGPVLAGLDAGIRPGDRVALLGPNGAGKSTLLALIAGLYSPTRGQVLLDGIPITEVDDGWLHRQVAVVLQDTYLFAGSLADNIRYGRPDASDEDLLRAARAALVTEFAERLPDGLDTVVESGGIGLSGGQRQRVGIARALLADAPVVLLDEPTTGLDVDAERTVVRALAHLVHDRTVLMTTHRPAIIELANRVLTLRDGRVTEAPVPRPAAVGKRIGPPPARPVGPVVRDLRAVPPPDPHRRRPAAARQRAADQRTVRFRLPSAPPEEQHGRRPGA